MGKQLILASLNARIVRPSDPAQDLHADIPQSLIKKTVGFPVMMNAVWMIDEFTMNNGTTQIVSGLHKSGYAQTSTGGEIRYIQKAVAPLGSVLILMGSVGTATGLIPAVVHGMLCSATTGTAVGCGSSGILITDLSQNG